MIEIDGRPGTLLLPPQNHHEPGTSHTTPAWLDMTIPVGVDAAGIGAESYWLTDVFGSTTYGTGTTLRPHPHTGVDLAPWPSKANVGNLPVRAAGDGEVGQGGEFLIPGDGIKVTVKHDDGYETKYLHLKASTVRSGDRVQHGDVIGYVGSSGGDWGPHLHFMVQDPDGDFVDPLGFLADPLSTKEATDLETMFGPYETVVDPRDPAAPPPLDVPADVEPVALARPTVNDAYLWITDAYVQVYDPTRKTLFVPIGYRTEPDGKRYEIYELRLEVK